MSASKPRRAGSYAALIATIGWLFAPLAPAQAACNTVSSTTTCSGTMSGAGVGASGDYVFDSTVNWDNFGLADMTQPPPDSFLFQTGATVTSGIVRSIAGGSNSVDVTIEQGASVNVNWRLLTGDSWTFDVAGSTGPIDTVNASGHADVTVSGTVSNAGYGNLTAAIGGHTTNGHGSSAMTGSVNILSGGLVESTSSMEAIFMLGDSVTVDNAGTISGNVRIGNYGFLNNNNQITGNVTTGDFSDLYNNAGATIAGTVTMGSDIVLENFGTITGGVTVGDNSTIDIRSGSSIGGPISMNGSNTTLRFMSSGSSSGGAYNLDNATGVTSLFYVSGADPWTFTGTTADAAPWSLANGSAMIMNASVAGTVSTNISSTLYGTGSIGGLDSRGVLDPGNGANAIGTLTVNGNALLRSSGTFRANISGTQSDKLAVNGAATIGGALDIRALGSSFGFSTPYTILTATGGVTGTFSSVTDNSAFLDPSVAYNANNVTLTMTRNAVNFADVLPTGGPGASGYIASLFDSIGLGASGDLINIFNAIFSLSAPEAQNAFQQLSGVTLTAPGAAIMAGGAKFDNAVSRNAGRAPGVTGASFADRLGFSNELQDIAPTGLAERPGYLGFTGGDFAKLGQLMDGNGPMLAAAPLDGDSGAGFWVSGYGIGGSVRGDENSNGFVYRGGGVLSGADYRWSDETLVGLAVGYGASVIDHQSSADEGQVNSIQASLYALHTPKGYENRLKLDGALGIARHDIQADRHLNFGGLDRTASSDHEAYELSARVGARYALKLDTPWTVEPQASLAYAKTYEDGYTETGAGIANLTVDDNESDSLIGRIGGRVTRSYVDERQRLWQPEASLAWRHEFADTEHTMQAAFSGLGSPFQVQGSEADRDALELGLGVGLLTASGISYGLNYSATLSDSETGHGLFANVRLAW